MTNALLVIDLQNDYFPGGKFPLWNTDVVLKNIERTIEKATAQGIPVVHNVHTTTCRAFTAAEMDKIVSKVHGG